MFLLTHQALFANESCGRNEKTATSQTMLKNISTEVSQDKRDHNTITSNMAELQCTPSSSVSSISSPRFSLWSRGHSSKSSSSSTIASQTRDSLDLYGSQKRLEDVREEEDYSTRPYCSCELLCLRTLFI